MSDVTHQITPYRAPAVPAASSSAVEPAAAASGGRSPVPLGRPGMPAAPDGDAAWPAGSLEARALAGMRAVAPDEADALAREWGPDLPANLRFAVAAAEELTTRVPGFRELLRAFGDDPVLVRAGAVIGRALARQAGNPSTVKGSAMNFDLPADVRTAQAEIDRIDAMKRSPDPRERERYKSRATQARLLALYTAVHGSAPVVDGQRRTS